MPRFLLKNRLFTLFFIFLNLTILSFFNPAWAQHSLTKTQTETNHPHDKVCVYIASYNLRNPWQKGTEEGLRPGINQLCDFKVFYMNSKRVHSPNKLKAIGLKAKQFIEQHHPDIILFSDDNAIHYVLKPYFQNSSVPTLFCGLNDNSTHYHFTSKLLTGMVEITHFKSIADQVNQIFRRPVQGAYLGGTGTSEEAHMTQIHQRLKFDTFESKTNAEWFKNLKNIENNPNYQYILIGNTSSIPHWDAPKAKRLLSKPSAQLHVTYVDFMMPYADVGITKSAQEQGNWLYQLTQAIFSGIPVQNIPIVSNRTFNYWYNEQNYERLKNFTLPNYYYPYQEVR